MANKPVLSACEDYSKALSDLSKACNGYEILDLCADVVKKSKNDKVKFTVNDSRAFRRGTDLSKKTLAKYLEIFDKHVDQKIWVNALDKLWGILEGCRQGGTILRELGELDPINAEEHLYLIENQQDFSCYEENIRVVEARKTMIAYVNDIVYSSIMNMENTPIRKMPQLKLLETPEINSEWHLTVSSTSMQSFWTGYPGMRRIFRKLLRAALKDQRFSLTYIIKIDGMNLKNPKMAIEDTHWYKTFDQIIKLLPEKNSGKFDVLYYPLTWNSVSNDQILPTHFFNQAANDIVFLRTANNGSGLLMLGQPIKKDKHHPMPDGAIYVKSGGASSGNDMYRILRKYAEHMADCALPALINLERLPFYDRVWAIENKASKSTSSGLTEIYVIYGMPDFTLDDSDAEKELKYRIKDRVIALNDTLSNGGEVIFIMPKSAIEAMSEDESKKFPDRIYNKSEKNFVERKRRLRQLMDKISAYGDNFKLILIEPQDELAIFANAVNAFIARIPNDAAKSDFSYHAFLEKRPKNENEQANCFEIGHKGLAEYGFMYYLNAIDKYLKNFETATSKASNEKEKFKTNVSYVYIDKVMRKLENKLQK